MTNYSFRERSDDDFISHPEHPEHGDWLDRQDAEERAREDAADDDDWDLTSDFEKLNKLIKLTLVEKLLFNKK